MNRLLQLSRAAARKPQVQFSLFVLLVIAGHAAVGDAQSTPVLGAACPASGQTGVTAAGIPVTCTQPPGGGAIVWTSYLPTTSGSAFAVVTNPSGGNQTIQPTDTTSIPLVIKEAASTTATSDFLIQNSAGATLVSFPPPSGANQTLTLGGGTASNVFWSGTSTGTNITMGSGTQTGTLGIKSTHISLGNFNSSHIEIGAANGDIAGNVTCSGSTVTKNFNASFTSTPTVMLSDRTTSGGAHLSAVSNSSFTVACTGTATDVVDYFVIGNAN